MQNIVKKKAKLIKLKDFDSAEYKNHIEESRVVEGVIIDTPTVGKCFYLFYEDRNSAFRTSTVKEVIDENTFRTNNSIYKLEICS